MLYSSKLFLNANNDDFYQSYVLQLREPANPRRPRDTDKLLWQAFQYFYKKIGQLEDVIRDGATLTGFLTEEIARRLLFIQITVNDELSAYTVFETLNARGMELTSTDLLKNYLFSLIHRGPDLRHVQYQWQKISNTVGTDRFPEFLRHYINSTEKLIRSQRLFRVIKEKIQQGKTALKL